MHDIRVDKSERKTYHHFFGLIWLFKVYFFLKKKRKKKIDKHLSLLESLANLKSIDMKDRYVFQCKKICGNDKQQLD